MNLLCLKNVGQDIVGGKFLGFSSRKKPQIDQLSTPKRSPLDIAQTCQGPYRLEYKKGWLTDDFILTCYTGVIQTLQDHTPKTAT
jgi:hypothetical protein